MRRLARWSPLFALLLVAVLTIALLTTGTGLRLGYRLAQPWIPGDFGVDELHGRLLGPIELSGLRFHDRDTDIRIGRLTLDWRPRALLGGRLAISNVRIDDVEVRLTPAPAKEPPRAGPSAGDFALAMPVRVTVEDLDLRAATLWLPDREAMTLDRLSLRADARDDALAIDALRIEAMGFSVNAEGRLPLASDGPLRLAASFSGDIDGQAVRGNAALSGTPARIEAQLALDSPIGALGEAVVEPLAGPPRWRASAGVDPFLLSEVLANGRPLRIRAAEVEAAGTGAELDARGHLAVSDDEFGAWGVDFDGSIDGGHRELRRIDIAALDGDTRLTGRASHAAADDRFEIALAWERLAWPPTGEAQARSPNGEATLTGRPDDYRFTTTGHWQIAELPPMALAIDGQGNRDGVEIGDMHGDFLDGQWRGAGRIDWQPALRWAFTLSADGVDPAPLHAGVAGRLDGRMRIDGGFDDHLSLAMDLESLAGELRGHPFDARARIGVEAGTIDIEDLAVRSGEIDLQGNARFNEHWDIAWRLDAGDFGALLPDLGGTARSQGTLNGPRDALRARFSIDAEGLTWDEHAAGQLGLAADLSLDSKGRWQVSLTADDVYAAGQALGRVSLDSAGMTRDHDAVLRIEHPDHRFEQLLAGALEGDRYHARLFDGQLEQKDVGAWSQHAEAILSVERDEAILEDYCLRQAASEICAGANRDGASLAGRLDWRAFDLARLNPWLPNPRARLDGATRGTAEFQLRTGRLAHLRLEAHGGAGALRYPLPPHGEMHALEFESIALNADADDVEGLRAAFLLALNDRERLDAELVLPDWRATSPLPAPEDALQARIGIELRDLTPVALMLPEWQAGDGAISAAIDIGGTVGTPHIDGSMQARLDHLVFTRFGIRLDEIGIDTRIRDNDWTLTGGARMDEGRFSLDGRGTARTATDWRGEVALNGEDLRLLRMPTAEITATPALTVRVDPRELVFGGSLLIPRARLEPVAPEPVTPVSADVVIAGAPEPEQPPAPFDVHGRMELILGDQVRLTGMGFEGRLTGRLLMMLERDGSLNGQGEIRVADGRYRAYGQNLSITQGRVLYAGGPLDNPAIDIIASRMRGEIEVGVRVTGTAEQPQVALFSNPAMDDADVLSYLIIGRPMDQAGEGDGQMLHQAATSVALVGGEALAERISERFDIAEVSIEAGDDAADTALVLGRALSRRLYVRYIQGLVENTNAFQLRYQLSDKWTIETESGTRAGAGADILYTLER